MHFVCHFAWYQVCVLLLQKQDSAGKEQKESLLQLLVQNVLKNPYIWGMALTYFFIYVVRQGVTSWFVFYLMKVDPLDSPPLLAMFEAAFAGAVR